MDLHVDDDAFVRAPAALVYRRLTDIGGWSQWWPGLRATALSTPDAEERWALELRRSRTRAMRVAARPHQWRHDAGFRLDLTGDIEGWAEFWLEPGWSGTVVHHVAVATITAPKPRNVAADYRAVLRRGLWSLKDDLQGAIRELSGLTP